MSISDWDNEFEVIVNRFLEVLDPRIRKSHVQGRFVTTVDKWQIHLIDADDDEDFTYGALCAALAQLGGNEHEWLLVHEFGSFYSLRHTDMAESLTNDE